MLFKLGYTISRLDIHSKESLELSIPGEDNIKIVIRSPNEEDRARGHQTFNAICDITGLFEPTKKALPVFTALLEGKRPHEGQKAKTAKDMVDREGPSYGIEYYPNPFISFVKKINNKLSDSARTAISYLRWRYAQNGPPAPIRTNGLRWSNDGGGNWLSLPGWYTLTMVTPPSSILKLDKISIDELKESIALGLDEPVCHELLREAKELKFESPRSSILISISAAEVAVRELIYKLDPNSHLLSENVRLPPLFKIIEEHFPQIIPEAKYNKIKETCDSLAAEIKKVIFTRNRVAHQGVHPPKDEKVEKIIQTVEQLLWLCDYCSGYEWAADYIDFQMRK